MKDDAEAQRGKGRVCRFEDAAAARQFQDCHSGEDATDSSLQTGSAPESELSATSAQFRATVDNGPAARASGNKEGVPGSPQPE